jgi:hypothetical protein
MTTSLLHFPAHTTVHPDRFEDETSGVGYEVFQDTDATDPRTEIDDEHVAIYAYREPRQGYGFPEAPENIAAQAFHRFLDYFDDKVAFAVTKRYLAIFRPELKLDLAYGTVRGYSQSDWIDVFVAAGEGYGTAASHMEIYRMWAFGDVWGVDPDEGEALGGIYADDPEDAVRVYLEHQAYQAA